MEPLASILDLAVPNQAPNNNQSGLVSSVINTQHTNQNTQHKEPNNNNQLSYQQPTISSSGAAAASAPQGGHYNLSSDYGSNQIHYQGGLDASKAAYRDQLAPLQTPGERTVPSSSQQQILSPRHQARHILKEL